MTGQSTSLASLTTAMSPDAIQVMPNSWLDDEALTAAHPDHAAVSLALLDPHETKV